VFKVLLYTLGVFALISAGSVFALCGDLWWQQISELCNSEHEKATSIVEDFQQARNNQIRDRENSISPLVKQAADFALCLNPPSPPEPKKEIPESIAKVLKKEPLEKNPPKITPRFKLLATSYYRSKPDKSVALISEPGREDRWVKKGEPLGHFVVERVEHGLIIYRYGNEMHEMAIDKRSPVRIAQALQPVLEIRDTNRYEFCNY